MTKRQKPFIARIQADGLPAEVRIIRQETRKEAQQLAQQMPTFGPEKLMYIRNLTAQALRGQLDKEVFKEFVRLTNSYMELESVAPRAQLLSKKGDS